MFKVRDDLDTKKIVLFILIALYPLRWISTGIDLWDVGYSCGNYVNFDTLSISRPWFYSTFMSLLTGHLLSLLPYGDTLAGLKLYCSMIISATVIISGFFCIRRLKFPVLAVLLGEAWAVSICYIPGPILYNHLTFLFLIASMIFLYIGLTEDKEVFLVFAGICLGINIFVRISNLPQALLILAVWYYLFLAGSPVAIYVRKTLACVAGYTAALLTVYILIGIKYGFGEYFSGITAMLSISDEAGDYSAGSMVKELILAYLHGGSRLVYIILFAIAACIIYRFLPTGKKNVNGSGAPGLSGTFVAAVASAGLIAFLLIRKVLIFDFYHYATVYYNSAFFLVLTVIISVINMAERSTDIKIKLISVMILMQMVVLSIGSGTGISPLMNSAFIIGPFLFGGLYNLFCRYLKVPDGEEGNMAAYKGIVTLISAIAIMAFVIQALSFGIMYEFEEGGNGAGGRNSVENNRVLGHTKGSKEKAEWMQGLTDYINEKGRSGSDVIIYGYAPALAFYLDLKPVITSWPDLDSYNVSLMKEDISGLEGRIDKGIADKPLIIIDNEGAAEQKDHNPEKWGIISDLMDRYDYVCDYEGERFSVYTADTY